jgi:hypothetical protein
MLSWYIKLKQEILSLLKLSNPVVYWQHYCFDIPEDHASILGTKPD